MMRVAVEPVRYWYPAATLFRIILGATCPYDKDERRRVDLSGGKS
jgi:hypothetical protein